MRFIKNALATGIPFGVLMSAFFSWRYGTVIGIPTGFAAGIFFGLSMSAFVEVQRRKLESKSGVFEGEMIIFQGPANHFMKREGRGGWLTLTETRLAFRSHGKNIQNDPLDIALDEIESVEACMTALIIPNGLRVTRKDGIVESFVVSTRKQWAQAVTQILSNNTLHTITRRPHSS